ncbi:MAG: PAS domain S-box protein [Ignavibacteriaceae bacterium]|nr:PAS domain S-box protein [Ignavibacteriaceae bacterium]
MSRSDKIVRSLNNLSNLIGKTEGSVSTPKDFPVIFKEYPEVLSSALFVKNIGSKRIELLYSYKMDAGTREEYSELLALPRFDRFDNSGKPFNPAKLITSATDKFRKLKKYDIRINALILRGSGDERIILFLATQKNDRLNKQETEYFSFAARLLASRRRESGKPPLPDFSVYDNLLLPVMIVEVDREEINIIYKNRAIKKFSQNLSLNADAVKFSELFREKFETLNLAEALRKKKVFEFGKATATLEGRMLRLSLKFSVTETENQFVCEVHDNTLQSEIQNKYHLTLSRVSALIQNMQSGVMLEDENRYMVLTNEEFCRMFAIPAPPEALIGMDCRAALDQAKDLFDSPEDFTALIDKLLEKKKISSGHELKLKDQRYFLLDYIPVFIEENYAGHLWNYRDVTVQIRLRQELVESGERYKKVVDSANDAIFEVSAEGKIIFINQTFFEKTGYSREDITESDYLSIVREDYREKVFRFYIAQFKGEKENSYFELPVITKDGRTIWLGQNSTLISENERVSYLLVIARDISDIKKAERQVLELKQFYEAILRDLPGQIAVFDRDLRYKFVNPASIKSREIREWIIGKDDYEYCRYRGLDEGIAEKRSANLRRVLDSRSQSSFQENFHIDGKIRTIIRTISPILDDQNKVQYLIGYGLDITDLKEAEQAIRRSEYQLNAVLNAVGEGIITINKYSEIVLVNDEILNQFGYKRDEMIGQPVHMIMPQQFRTLHDQGMIRYMSSGTSRILGLPLELEGVKKDGSHFPIQVKIQKAEIEDQFYFTAAVIDISENKKIMEELIQAKQLAEKSTHAKEQFLAHMSHEIRTPMNAIVGIVNLLLQMKPGGKQFDYLTAIKKSTDNLLVIINDILDFSKITAGKIELESEDFCIDKVFEQVMQIMLPKAEEKVLKFVMNRDPKIPPVLIGDKVRLGQILLNLVSNAIKFTERGGVSLTIELAAVKEDRANIKFIVADTGVGISADEIESVFDSFKQMRGGHSAKVMGTGLGLSITKLLVEMQGGKISVESKVGQGSTFIVGLEFSISGKDAGEFDESIGEEISAEVLKDKRILVAEDNEFNRIVITNYLELWGAEYDVAVNGRKCIGLLQEQNYDVVLMDLGMPEMDGYEAVRFIRNNLSDPVKDIPVIALTASALLDVKHKVLDAGMNDYVSKPFKPQELVQKILKVLGLLTVIDIPEEPEAPDENKVSAYKFVDVAILDDTCAGDSEFAVELITNFFESTADRFAEIENALASGKMDDLVRILHKVKSPFGYLGMRQITQMLDQMEKEAGAGAPVNELNLRIAQVADIWESAKIELLDVLEMHRRNLS